MYLRKALKLIEEQSDSITLGKTLLAVGPVAETIHLILQICINVMVLLELSRQKNF